MSDRKEANRHHRGGSQNLAPGPKGPTGPMGRMGRMGPMGPMGRMRPMGPKGPGAKSVAFSQGQVASKFIITGSPGAQKTEIYKKCPNPGLNQ